MAADDYLTELKTSNTIAELDYDALSTAKDNLKYRYDRGIDESMTIELLNDTADNSRRGSKGTRRREPVQRSAAAPSFSIPSFDAFTAPSFSIPSFDAFTAPSFEIPNFDAPKFELPKFESPVKSAVDESEAEIPTVVESVVAGQNAEELRKAKAAEVAAEREAKAAEAAAEREAKAAEAAAEREAKAAEAAAEREAKAAEAAARKAADDEARAARDAAREAEKAAKVEDKVVASSGASTDLGFDFGPLSQYMESTPSAPKVDKKAEEKARKAEAAAAAAEAKRAAAEAKRLAEEEKRAAKMAPRSSSADFSSDDLDFDFGILSQYMTSSDTGAASSGASEKAAAKAAAKAAEQQANEAAAEAKRIARIQAQEAADAKRAAVKAELAAKKNAAKSGVRPTYKKQTVAKVKPEYTKGNAFTPFTPFAGVSRLTAVQRAPLPGIDVNVDAIIDGQEAKAEATLARANEDAGDFLNLQSSAAFGVAATLGLIAETRSKEMREKQEQTARNATSKSGFVSQAGSGGASTTEGWFDKALAKYMDPEVAAKVTAMPTISINNSGYDISKSPRKKVANNKPASKFVEGTPAKVTTKVTESAEPAKPAAKSAVTKSDPVKNASQAQSWIDKWTSKPAAPAATASKPVVAKSDPVKNAAEAQNWISKWTSSTKSTVASSSKSDTTVANSSSTVTTTTVKKASFVSSDSLSPEQRAAAEQWIKKWREDGRPTDETKFDDAKKWLNSRTYIEE